jgi:hypothetical protein
MHCFSIIPLGNGLYCFIYPLTKAHSSIRYKEIMSGARCIYAGFSGFHYRNPSQGIRC